MAGSLRSLALCNHRWGFCISVHAACCCRNSRGLYHQRTAPREAAAGRYRRRLRSRGTIPRTRGDAARLRRHRRGDVAARRSLLVPQRASHWRRVHLVDPVKKTRTRAFDHAKLAAALSTAAGATFDELGLPFQTMDLSPDRATVSFNLAAKRWSCDAQGSKCATTGDAMVPARRLRPYAADADVAPRRTNIQRRQTTHHLAGCEARSLHPRLEPLGDGHRDAAGTPADHRRRQVFRLRHGQRWLERQRSRHRALVARLEEDRDAAAGRARSRRDVPRLDRRRASDAARLEVPVAWRQGHGDAPPRRHRGRHGTYSPAADGARLPSRHARRRYQRARLQLEPDSSQLALASVSRVRCSRTR